MVFFTYFENKFNSYFWKSFFNYFMYEEATRFFLSFVNYQNLIIYLAVFGIKYGDVEFFYPSV